jgi:glycosyltransferase involved in cell wall biosynthesis
MNPADVDASRPAYALISPVRDEADYIGCTLASVISQSVKPAAWVLVDDGSTDGTRELLEQAASRTDFIRVVSLADRGYRQPGAGVVQAFQRGLEGLSDVPWEFVGKLDGDVQVPCRYYESLLDEFLKDPKLGIASGACITPRGKKFRLEKNVPQHTRGPCKVYRRACLEEIGGLVPTLGWDGLDGYMARKRGWSTRTVTELQVIHFRPTHSGQGRLRGGMRAGRGAYFMHYRPGYLLARAMVHLFRPPYLLGGMGLMLGFLAAHLKREKRIDDPELIGFIRREQTETLKRRGR